MASPKPVEICVVTKTYQGEEGNRVRAGTRFAIGKPQGDLKVITAPRYQSLRNNKLVRPLGEEDAGALPRARYGAGPTKMEGSGTGVQVARNVRQNARMRVRQDEEPAAPKAVAQTGFPTGKAKSESSSLGAPAPNASTSTSRGTRRTQR